MHYHLEPYPREGEQRRPLMGLKLKNQKRVISFYVSKGQPAAKRYGAIYGIQWPNVLGAVRVHVKTLRSKVTLHISAKTQTVSYTDVFMAEWSEHKTKDLRRAW